MRQTSTNSTASSSDFILKPNTDWYIRRPAKEGATVFRILPHMLPDGTEQPQLLDPAAKYTNPKDNVSEAFAEYECMRFAGKLDYQFITEVSDQVLGCQTPAMMFWRAMYDYKEKHRKECPDEWYNWFERKDGKYEKLQKPRSNLFVKGVLVKFKGQDIMDRNGSPMVLYPLILHIHQSSAAENLIKGITDTVSPDYLGDIVSCKGGSLISIYPENRQNPQTRRMQAYYMVKKSEPYPLTTEFAKGIFKPWEDLINVQTSTWVIDRLSETFSPSAVAFALTDTPYGRHISEHIRAAVRDVPAASPSTVAVGYAPVSTGVSSAPAPMPQPVMAPAPRPNIPVPPPVAVRAPAPMDVDNDDDPEDDIPLPPPGNKTAAQICMPTPLTTQPPAGPALGGQVPAPQGMPSPDDLKRKLAEAQEQLRLLGGKQ
jgi:hypothetical protein